MRRQALSASSADSSLAAEAYGVVRRRILRGEISLGQSVSRRKVAAELGMSFLPVSEALLRLEFEGLLESRPRAGTRVRIPSPEDVRGHYLVREILEAEAARLFAQVATKRERAQLVRFYLGRGTVDGARILSEASVARIERSESTLASRYGFTNGYGLGDAPIPDADFARDVEAAIDARRDSFEPHAWD